jgi:hypothetical protein
MMNTIKTVVMVTVLLAVGYGVYTQINSNSPAPAPGAATPSPGGAASSPAAPSPGGPSPAPQINISIPGLPGAGEPARGGEPGASGWPQGPGGERSPAGPPWSGKDPLAPGGNVSRGLPGGEAARSGEIGAAPGTPRAPGGNATVNAAFRALMESAQAKLDQDALPEVLLTLSQFYNEPSLTAEQSRELNDLLDRLAGTVIYSRQHRLEEAYRVRPGERLEAIAQEYKVPWQLLAKINGLRDPDRLQADDRLKVVRGPFEAVISKHQYSLTLSVAGRYAGRFRIGLGDPQRLREGVYTVQEKLPGRPYFASDRAIEADDPKNPLGHRWIGLNGDVGIHGTNDPSTVGRSGCPGTICLEDRDIEDVYDILSIGSKVTIQR